MAKDDDVQDILTLNLTCSIQLCIDIGAHLISGTELPPPNTMGQTFDISMEAGIIDAELAGRMKKRWDFVT